MDRAARIPRSYFTCEENITNGLRLPLYLLECLLDLQARCVALRAQDAVLSDGRKIAIFERNPAEAGLEVREGVLEVAHFGTQGMLAHQRTQIALASDEAHNRNWTRSSAGLDQLHQLRR